MGGATDFLQAFSNDESFFLSQPYLWKIDIGGGLNSAIQSALTKGNEQWEANVDPSILTKNGAILVARSITTPQESSVFAAQGVENRGGFLPGYSLIERNDFLTRSFTINFIETQKDIEHGFFRPWMIALGIDGLINFGLKADITVNQFDNEGSARKGYVFKEAFPTAVEGYTIDHNSDDFIEKSVTFACKNYAQT